MSRQQGKHSVLKENIQYLNLFTFSIFLGRPPGSGPALPMRIRIHNPGIADLTQGRYRMRTGSVKTTGLINNNPVNRENITERQWFFEKLKFMLSSHRNKPLQLNDFRAECYQYPIICFAYQNILIECNQIDKELK
jgi:hypothetical protein